MVPNHQPELYMTCLYLLYGVMSLNWMHIYCSHLGRHRPVFLDPAGGSSKIPWKVIVQIMLIEPQSPRTENLLRQPGTTENPQGSVRSNFVRQHAKMSSVLVDFCICGRAQFIAWHMVVTTFQSRTSAPGQWTGHMPCHAMRWVCPKNT